MARTVSAAIIPHAVPIYEYKCENGHVFDVIQKITDEALSECQECGAPAARVLHPVAVHFKGSGFYNTDYGKKKGASNGSGNEGSKESQREPSTTGSDSKSGGESSSKASETKAPASD
jgi:putative FmdB family regulatory protein